MQPCHPEPPPADPDTHAESGLLRTYRPALRVGTVLHRVSPELLVIMHQPTGRWTVLNTAGAALAEQADGTRTLEEIEGRLASNGIPRPGAARTMAFFDALAAAGLLDAGARGHSPPPAAKHLPANRFHAVSLDITDRCNQQCVYCARACAGAGVPGDRGELPVETIRRLIDEVASLGGEHFIVTGGEPLLREDTLDILRYAGDKGLKPELATNGRALTRDTVAQLRGIVTKVQISLDSSEAGIHDALRGNGSHAAAMAALGEMGRVGILKITAIAMTVTSRNRDQFEAVARLAARLGASALNVYPVKRQGRAAASWNDLALSTGELEDLFGRMYALTLEMKETLAIASPGCDYMGATPAKQVLPPPGCDAGYFVVIDSGGNVYPCDGLRSAEFRLGNIRNLSLSQMLRGEMLSQLMARLRRRSVELEECRACAWQPYCGGGCAGMAYEDTGSIGSSDRLCSLRRHLYDQIAIRQWEKAHARRT